MTPEQLKDRNTAISKAKRNQSPEHIAKRAAAVAAAWEDPLKRARMSRRKIGARKEVKLPHALARLRMERILRNLSQEALAEDVGVSINTISNCERNSSRPSFDNLVAWGQAFGWELTWREIKDDAGHV